MALTYLIFKVANLDAKKWIEKRFLVDSGAVYSVMPGQVLKSLGVKPIDSQRFILANGEEIKKDIGQAWFSLRGKRRVVPVIFGDPDIYLVGATTLENLGLILDPISRELKPLPMVVM